MGDGFSYLNIGTRNLVIRPKLSRLPANPCTPAELRWQEPSHGNAFAGLVSLHSTISLSTTFRYASLQSEQLSAFTQPQRPPWKGEMSGLRQKSGKRCSCSPAAFEQPPCRDSYEATRICDIPAMIETTIYVAKYTRMLKLWTCEADGLDHPKARRH